MLDTMYDAPGLGLAAPQVGVQKRLFVYDLGRRAPDVLINPVIVETDGEWAYEEGCLSVPGLSWEIVRPEEIHLVGLRPRRQRGRRSRPTSSRPACFQHELDHLDGVLLLEHLDDDQRKEAKKAVRELHARRRPRRAERAPRPGGLRLSLTPASAVPPLAAPGHPRASSSSARPRWRCRRCGPCIDAGFDDRRSWSRRPDKRRGRRGEPDAQPGEGGRARARPAGHRRRRRRRSTPAPTSAWWWPTGASSARTSSTRVPMVNLHFSLLPRWRGAAPVERAILAGDERTGVCLMAVEEGLDTGGVYAAAEVADRPRRARPTSCAAELVDVGTALLVDALRAGLGDAGAAGRRAHLRREARRRRARSSTGPRRPIELDRLVRVGGAWTTFRGQRLKVLAADAARRRAGADGAPGELDGAAVGDRRRRARAGRGAARGQGPPCRSTPGRNGARPGARRAARASDRPSRGRARRAPATPGGRADPAGRARRAASASSATAPTPTSSCPALLGRSGLDDRDRAFVTELVYGTTRMRRACDWLVDRFVLPRRSTRRPGPRCASAPTSSRSSTRPPHAAVSATVGAAPRKIAGPRQRGAAPGGRRRPRDWPDDATRPQLPRLDRRPAHRRPRADDAPSPRSRR